MLFRSSKEFDRLPIVRDASDPDRDHIDPRMIDTDLKKLTAQEQVLTHIQTTIAHRVPESPGVAVPTYGAFHDAIKAVEKVLGSYYLILTHKSVVNWEPVPQYDVLKPFGFPWIRDPKQFDYKHCE